MKRSGHAIEPFDFSLPPTKASGNKILSRILSRTRFRRLDGIIKAYSPTLRQRIMEASAGGTKAAPAWAHSSWMQLKKACNEMSQVRINEGWRCYHAAVRSETKGLSELEIDIKAKQLMMEATKLKKWRKEAVLALISEPTNPSLPKKPLSPEELAAGMKIRDEQYEGKYFKQRLLKNQLFALAMVLILVGVGLMLTFGVWPMDMDLSKVKPAYTSVMALGEVSDSIQAFNSKLPAPASMTDSTSRVAFAKLANEFGQLSRSFGLKSNAALTAIEPFAEKATGDSSTAGMIWRVILFGLLGGIISAIFTFRGSSMHSDSPELITDWYFTAIRITVAAGSALAIYTFLNADLWDKVFSVALGDIAPATIYAISIVAGFSERLLVQAVDKIVGKQAGKPDPDGAGAAG
ncbi:MAG: hypothetical protein AAF206_06390 [Bacteroidota bacterium]